MTDDQPKPPPAATPDMSGDVCPLCGGDVINAVCAVPGWPVGMFARVVTCEACLRKAANNQLILPAKEIPRPSG